MTLAFILSMPGCPSWNGRWSGQDKLHAVLKHISRSQKAEATESIWTYGEIYADHQKPQLQVEP